jgi:hypothetical protein
MPQLVFPPQNPTWPPPEYIDPRVTRYQVARVGSCGESFLDICQRFGIKFDDLIQFNFGLKRSEPHYFEKINWYLKNKLGCTKTTAGGNFIFSGGETIYIPARGYKFDPVPVNAPSWLASHTVIEGNASYIPVADFIKKIKGCLQMLDGLAPEYAKWFSQYNLKIRSVGRASGANFANKSIDLAPETFNAHETWVASVIIHETVHFWQYWSGHYQAGEVAEVEANRYQLNVLRLLDAPQNVILHMMAQDGKHADENGDGVYDEKDYNLRRH